MIKDHSSPHYKDLTCLQAQGASGTFVQSWRACYLAPLVKQILALSVSAASSRQRLPPKETSAPGDT